MRLGDLDALKAQLKKLPMMSNWGEAFIPRLIDEQPTISAVPVVRCCECKRWDDNPDSYGKDDGPKGKCMKSFEETYADDFCSYGQRKIETVLPKSDAKDESLEETHANTRKNAR